MIAVDSNPARLDMDVIHGYLAASYWARGISRELLERAVRNSVCFGVYENDRQVGFARVVTDQATFAYLADVFILESHRGQGLATKLVAAIASDERLQGLRRWVLVTRDAHGLYEKFGFKALAAPQRFMELHNPDVYAQRAGGSGR
jgi:GNAT superfamily N-acetyltransferase